jgi:putative methionine-R-sulfoxide reductase with GAF domain
VYCVCMACLHHTYVETDWVGFYLGGPDRGDEGGAVS